MGEVCLAEDTSLERKLALKFLPEILQQDQIAHQRFLREAESAAALELRKAQRNVPMYPAPSLRSEIVLRGLRNSRCKTLIARRIRGQDDRFKNYVSRYCTRWPMFFAGHTIFFVSKQARV